jgi:hypothetical protein
VQGVREAPMEALREAVGPRLAGRIKAHLDKVHLDGSAA